MATAESIITRFRSILGLKEDCGENCNMITKWYGVTGPWCAMTVSWVMHQEGMNNIRFAWCDDGIRNFKSGAWGKWITQYDTILPGDVVFYDWGDHGPSDHVGIVETVNGNTSFTALEGNWGDQVSRVSRDRTYVVGFGRPFYSNPQSVVPLPAPVSNDAIRTIQKLLNIVLASQKQKIISVDGVNGPETTNAVKWFQTFANSMYALAGEKKRLIVDGEVGSATSPVLQWWSRAVISPSPPRPIAPEPTLKLGSRGDKVRQLQGALNYATKSKLVNDGVYGDATMRTVRSLQGLYKISNDGIYGPQTKRILNYAISLR